jgi:hypothetical protein
MTMLGRISRYSLQRFGHVESLEQRLALSCSSSLLPGADPEPHDPPPPGDRDRPAYYLNSSWHNRLQASDVSGDGAITPRDAIIVINELEQRRFSDPLTSELPDDASAIAESRPVDVVCDGLVTARDALRVINDIGRTFIIDLNGSELGTTSSVQHPDIHTPVPLLKQDVSIYPLDTETLQSASIELILYARENTGIASGSLDVITDGTNITALQSLSGLYLSGEDSIENYEMVLERIQFSLDLIYGDATRLHFYYSIWIYDGVTSAEAVAKIDLSQVASG